MEITFLGTGTSHGVPKIGCLCPVCSSADEKNKRLRSSILIKSESSHLLVDTSIDFRQQALKYNINYITHVLVTHIHADHIFGLDDMRVFNKLTGSNLSLYMNADFDGKIRSIFPYMYKELFQQGGGVTQVKNTVLNPYEKYDINGFTVIPLPVKHGKLDIFGYRINDIAYITDASFIPEETLNKLKGVKLLILNALRHRPHSTHFTVAESVDIAGQVNAERTFFTHICHDLDHESTNSQLPEGMRLAYDGLVVNT